MATEIIGSGVEPFQEDPYHGPMIVISSEVVPALTAKTTWVPATYLISREQPDRPEVIDFTEGHYEHRLGPQLTEEERLSVVNDALLYFRIGEIGVQSTQVQSMIDRFSQLTKPEQDRLPRNRDTVSWLIQTALAVVDPDRQTGEAVLTSMFGDQTQTEH